MSQPLAGNYYMVSSPPGAGETLLAITYNGKNVALTVTELTGGSTQEWFIADYISGETQTISPQNATDLEACYDGANEVTVLPAGGYDWGITGQDDVYTIQDGGHTVVWSLLEAAVGQSVQITVSSGSPLQNWALVPV